MRMPDPIPVNVTIRVQASAEAADLPPEQLEPIRREALATARQVLVDAFRAAGLQVSVEAD